MEAHVKTVREILHSGDQFLVPFFQRQYSWTKKEWMNLYTDVLALFEGGDETKHFMGPLVCTPFNHVPAETPRYQLIDGQQRLTTLTIALAALRDVSRINGLTDLADEIHEDYLVHKRRQDLERFKVVPRLEDRENYAKVLDGTAPGVIAGSGIVGCHSFFKRAWRSPVSDGGETSARRIFAALTNRLSLVAITIDGENPYEIFESLNGKGLPLEEADLIRNFLFMQVPQNHQASFHQAHWQRFESQFEEVDQYDKVPPTPFYRNYLMRNGRYCPNRTAFIEFKKQNTDRGLNAVEQVSELERFAKFELWLHRPELCERPYLRRRLTELRQLDVSTSHPLLLNLLDRHDKAQLDRDALDECLRDLISFIVRRSICGESTRGYGRWFPEAVHAIVTRPAADLRRYWLDKGWPDDATFISRLVEFPIYIREPKKCRMMLEILERMEGHREEVNLSTLTIEHVLPQMVENDEEGRAWKAAFGPNWRQEHETWLHTLGNLTLTGYNTSLSNKSFASKKALFVQSNVSLNVHFAALPAWDVAAIRQRGQSLGRRLASIWTRPAGEAYTPRQPNQEDAFGDAFEQPDALQGRAPHTHGNLRVMIRWSLLGVNKTDELIQEATAAATQSVFIGKLIEWKPELLNRFQNIPVARTYSLSANPDSDFLNPSTNKTFGNKLVPGTALYLFTNTSTGAKCQDIDSLIRRIGMPGDSVVATQL
jgi:hypothetical protein